MVVVWFSIYRHEKRLAMARSDILKWKVKKVIEFIPILKEEALDRF